MSPSLTDLVVKGTTAVSAGGIAVRQIQSYLARQHLQAGRSAWLTPAVVTYRDWATALWHRYLDDGSRQLLTPGQVDALWRRVIDESGAGLQGVPGYSHISTWAREASQRRRDWNVDIDDLHAFRDDPDCRAFLRWERAYRDILDDAGWMDPVDAVDALAVRAPAPAGNGTASVVWADLTLSPLQSQLAERLRVAGFKCSDWTPPNCNRRSRRIQLADASEEVRVAAAWAAARLARQPGQRLAMVVPGLEARRDEVVGALEEALYPDSLRLGARTGHRQIVCLQGQATAMDNPMIGAAMNALELFGGAGDFPVLSRWLRSPFFGAADHADARCMLETQLRSHVSSQMSFLDAYRSGGLAGRIRATMPALADELDAAVSLTSAHPRRATLTAWVTVWRRLLDGLAWGGQDTAVPDEWESALNDLVLLTPILGRLDPSDALAELERILGRPQRLGAVPLHGVFLLASPENVGPGYDAAWVSGLTDTQWPQASQPIPLLPSTLQRRHDMPWATPAATLEQSRIAIQRLVDRVPDVVLSSPESVHEHSVQPSPLILSWPLVTEADLLGSRVRRSRQTGIDGSRLETSADPVPPVESRKLRGGIGTLSMQSICPLRAFIESRLTAKSLDAVRPGFNARQRGIAAHAAVRRLFGDLPDRRELLSWSPEDRRRRIERSCQLSLRGVFGVAENRLGALFDLEMARLRSMLAHLLDLESTRTHFRVAGVEQSIKVDVGGIEITGRLDRIDELGSDGSLAVIDYKTGRRNNPGDWLKERPRDLQLPFYAAFLQAEVEAVAIAVLNPASPQYKGLWLGGGPFPGRSARLPAEFTWPRQRERWRTQLETLAREYADGDGRIFLNEIRQAEGWIAPLTRVHEWTALARKADPRAARNGP